jgi:cytochrome c oxidase cbb3-type subunit III
VNANASRLSRPTSLGLVASLFVLATGCDLPGRPNPEDAFKPPDQVLDFDTLFRQNCTACHGADGQLGPAPPLNDALFLQIVPDDDLLMAISGGRRGTPMPAFAHDQGGPLTDKQVEVLASGIKPKWRSTQKAHDKPPDYEVADVKTANKSTGARAFARACASCHGDHGQGGKYAGDPAGRPVGAINDPSFLGLISNQALRRIVITGRPDLEMPDYAGKTGRPMDYEPLTSREITDLVALLASWRKGSAK